MCTPFIEVTGKYHYVFQYFRPFWYLNRHLKVHFCSQLRWMAIFRETLIQLRVADRQREARRCGPCSPLGIPTAHSAGWRIMPVVHNPLWPVGAQHLYQKHLKRKYNTWHDL